MLLAWEGGRSGWAQEARSWGIGLRAGGEGHEHGDQAQGQGPRAGGGGLKRSGCQKSRDQEAREYGLGPENRSSLWLVEEGSRARARRWGMPEIGCSGWRLESKGLGASRLKRQRLGSKIGLGGKVFGLEESGQGL